VCFGAQECGSESEAYPVLPSRSKLTYAGAKLAIPVADVPPRNAEPGIKRCIRLLPGATFPLRDQHGNRGKLPPGCIQNGLLLMGYPYYAQWLVTWVVIILAVWLDVATKRGRLFSTTA